MAKKKKPKMSTGCRDNARWVMQLADYLERNYEKSRSQCVKQAWLVWKLLKAMREEKVLQEFLYLKDDGTERRAHGTLNEYLMPYSALAKGTAQQPWPRESFSYWDAGKKGWRSFKASALVYVVFNHYADTDFMYCDTNEEKQNE